MRKHTYIIHNLREVKGFVHTCTSGRQAQPDVSPKSPVCSWTEAPCCDQKLIKEADELFSMVHMNVLEMIIYLLGPWSWGPHPQLYRGRDCEEDFMELSQHPSPGRLQPVFYMNKEKLLSGLSHCYFRFMLLTVESNPNWYNHYPTRTVAEKYISRIHHINPLL